MEEDKTYNKLVRATEAELLEAVKMAIPYRSKSTYEDIAVFCAIAEKHKWGASEAARRMFEYMQELETEQLATKINDILKK